MPQQFYWAKTECDNRLYLITSTNKAVILARGLGMRMRARTAGTYLTDEQSRYASAGIKTLIPIADGQTLLELIVKNLRSAGFEQICLVIGPEHDAIREFCAQKRLDVTFSVQNEPLGTADAVLAAQTCTRSDELFLVVNSDNLYPVESLRRLQEAGRPAMLAFERAALIDKSNIPEDRIAKFATAEVDDQGFLRRIVEKPVSIERDALVSMNAWLFSPLIFDACRAIGPSERGEYEITAAVQYAIDDLGADFMAVRTREGVLDLSSRADVADIARFLDK